MHEVVFDCPELVFRRRGAECQPLQRRPARADARLLDQLSRYSVLLQNAVTFSITSASSLTPTTSFLKSAAPGLASAA